MEIGDIYRTRNGLIAIVYNITVMEGNAEPSAVGVIFGYNGRFAWDMGGSCHKGEISDYDLVSYLGSVRSTGIII